MGGGCDVEVLPPRLLFPRGLLVQDVSCDPKLCSSHPEHPELLLEPCGRLRAVGWAPFMVLCRNSSCQTLATRPRGLWGSSTGAEGALEPPASSIRDFLLREPGGRQEAVGDAESPHCSLRAASHAELRVCHRQELLHLGSPGHTHTSAKSSQSCFPPSHWLQVGRS